MRSRMRAVGLTLAFACALVVSGCTPPQSSPTPTPSPAATPVFASDAEALAAATAAYKKYILVSNLVAHSGGAQPDRISSVATGEVLRDDLSTFARFRSQMLRGTGSATFRNFRIQSTDVSTGAIGAYVCLDVSDTDVVDAKGASTLTADRVTVVPFELKFERGSGEDLLLAESSVWKGGSVC